MNRIKLGRYHYSPSLPLLDPSIVEERNFHRWRKYDQQHEYVDEQYSDLLSHDKMSWGSLEDRYILHEIQSDDISFLTSSCTINSSYSDWNGWQPVSGDEEKWNLIMTNNWGAYSLHTKPWNNEKAPVVKIRYSNKTLFDNLEYSGFLTDRLVGVGSFFLSKTPESGLYILAKFIMRNKSLCDISILYFHRYLQYIDLSYNNISDLSPLSGIPYLMYLNVSHNKQFIHSLEFKPPWYLTYVNLSNNHILKISDFSSFWSIVQLDLSHNAIEVISGLEKLKYLRCLNLSYNLIECVENLDNLNIEELDLEGNSITSFKTTMPNHGINVLANLRIINLSNNRLSSLMFFKDSYGLRVVNLKFNKINDLLEIAHLKGPISEIDLRGNRCTKWPNYKDVIVLTLPSVTVIDGSHVSITDKISAMLLFASPLDLVAARSVTKLTSIEQLNKPLIGLHIKPYDEISPPLIILTGPSAVKKVALAQHVVLKLANKIKYCRWHTTRELEEDNPYEQKSYIFTQRERFNDMAHRGDFLALQELLGNSYGFHHDQISGLIRERKIGITQMDLNATLQMRKRYSNVRPILVLTNSEEIHHDWIHDKFNVFTWIRDSVEQLFAVEIGKQKDKNVLEETADSKTSFVAEIVDTLIQDLDLAIRTEYVTPPSTGTTTTDMINERGISNTTKATIRTGSIMSDKRHIKFQESYTSHILKKGCKVMQTEKHKTKGLKVLLDEESNIIRDDDETKRTRLRLQALYRRRMLDLLSTEAYIDDLDESVSSDDTIVVSNMEELEDLGKVERLKSKYAELVLKSRKLYMDHHLSKPGFFSLVLFTDNYTKAFNVLVDFVYELYKFHSTDKPMAKPEMDYYKRFAIPNAVKAITKEIQLSLSSAVLQRRKSLCMYGVSSWKNLMPSQMF